MASSVCPLKLRHLHARPSPDDSAHDRYAAWKTACNVDCRLPGNNASSVIVRGSPATTAGRRQAAVHIDDAMPRIRKAFPFCRVVPWRWHILKLRKNQFRHWHRVIATGNRYSNSCAGACMLSMYVLKFNRQQRKGDRITSKVIKLFSKDLICLRPLQ